MSSEAATADILDEARFQKETLGGLRANLFVVLAGILFALPTIVKLASQSWSLEIGAHGPIVLATGLWLVSRCDWSEPDNRATAIEPLAWLGLLASLAVYAFG